MIAMVKLRLALSLVGLISALCHCSTTYTPADNYLISCGSNVDTPVARRVFVADDSSSVTLTASHSAAVRASPGVVSGFDGAAVYLTARVFTAPSSYAFRITRPGRHFVRLHFFPFECDGYDLAANASFKVSTQDAVLIDSFAPVRTNNASSSPVREEFLLRVDRDTLIITFVPLSGSSLAFVNAVEVVSAPDDLVGARAETVVPTGGQQLDPAVLPLQTACRVNVGGPEVAADGDALWREWATDGRFLIGIVATRDVVYDGSLNRISGEATREDAPDDVYATAREMDGSNWVDTSKQMTWQFDVGDAQPAAASSYLVRLHFCDVVSRAPHQLLIDVYLNGYAAVTGLDLSAIGGGALAFPYFTDFILESSDPAGKVSVTIGSLSTMKRNGTLPGPILNGIEIMKMRFSSGSVAVVEPGTGSRKQQLAVVVGSLCGAFTAVSVAVVLVVVLRKKKEEKVLPSSSSPQSSPMPLLPRFSFRSGRPSASGTGSPSFTSNTPGANPVMMGSSPVPIYRVPLATLQAATNNFDERLAIGAGGFGTVYRAALPDGTTVAAKRASPESRQGVREFRTEVETLSGLRHRHLVSLVGYCDEGDEMVLLYEYMEQGTLRSHLYGSGGAGATLSWAQRLEACVGAASGLLYLHTALARPVIHRDVKSSNILLDAGLAAKVADFGLSRAGPDIDETHVSTTVKGSFGYVDPEYLRTRRLTPMSDVYSLGVVLLEALCGRPVVDPRLPKPMANLVEWGLHWQRRGELDKVVDRRVAGEVRPAALRKYGETVARCLAERGADRPGMEDVVWSLKFVAWLQDDGNGLDFSDVNSMNFVYGLTPPACPTQPRSSPGSETGGKEGDDMDGVNYTDVSMGGIFRQMINARGR
jgi:hypothetical protein